nr:MAG TPA: hypothetical protein [Caudoviricetes sp.]
MTTSSTKYLVIFITLLKVVFFPRVAALEFQLLFTT